MTDTPDAAPPSREPTLREMYDEQCRETKRFHNAIAERLPAGTRVYVDRYGSAPTPVTVVKTAWDRVQVHNKDSGKTYWVDIHRLEGMGYV